MLELAPAPRANYFICLQVGWALQEYQPGQGAALVADGNQGCRREAELLIAPDAGCDFDTCFPRCRRKSLCSSLVQRWRPLARCVCLEWGLGAFMGGTVEVCVTPRPPKPHLLTWACHESFVHGDLRSIAGAWDSFFPLQRHSISCPHSPPTLSLILGPREFYVLGKRGSKSGGLAKWLAGKNLGM